MRIVMRILLLLLVFVGVGWVTTTEVMRHTESQAQNSGTMESQVRLAGEMAGLFAGGAATVIVGIALVWFRKEL